jgi:hypothetical protein
LRCISGRGHAPLFPNREGSASVWSNLDVIRYEGLFSLFGREAFAETRAGITGKPRHSVMAPIRVPRVDYGSDAFRRLYVRVRSSYLVLPASVPDSQ